MFLLIFTEQTPPPVAVPHQDHRAMQLLSLGMKNRKPSSTQAHPSTLKSGIVAEVIVHQSQEQKLHEILNLRTLGNLDCVESSVSPEAYREENLRRFNHHVISYYRSAYACLNRHTPFV